MWYSLSARILHRAPPPPAPSVLDSGMGCYVDNVCANYVFYADDLCLMAPCAIALQQLINVCHRYSIIVDLNFNALKSFCFAFTPNFIN